LYGALVFAGSVGSGTGTRLSRLLRSRLLTGFGKYSYGIYVYHYPIAIYLNDLTPRACAHLPQMLRIPLSVASMLLGIAISYGVAQVSWRFIERRALSFKDRFRAL
jgi:peptidoglycan/LPS O-acetylase OafA/YrhL